ncbi:MAG: hypothetical protein HC888_16920, partial [Candidatus Competibacteraceae bacterium]|nr:hypothetical protein [Candidatus Competibacteraceae bacterium]
GSRRAGFAVSGERVLERDRDGLLVREEALRLSREEWGLAVEAPLDAKLIVNEAGFLDWMVRNPAEGAEGAVLLINPYLGQLRRVGDAALWQETPEQQLPMPVYTPRVSAKRRRAWHCSYNPH